MDRHKAAKGWGLLVQAFFLVSINLGYWFLRVDRQQEDYCDTATSLLEGVVLVPNSLGRNANAE